MDSGTDVTAYRLHPISADVASALRRAGGETHVADSTPGYPCRQCLRDAEIGDRMILTSHLPFEGHSPYRSASPIFLHEDDCSERVDEANVPHQLACRQLSVRAFDADELMTDAAVIDGPDLPATLSSFFEDPLVLRVHIHNASRGCWAVSAERAA